MNTEQQLAKLKKAQRKLENAIEMIFDAGTLSDEVMYDGMLAVGHRFVYLREPIQSEIALIVKLQADIRTKKDETNEVA